MIDEVGALRPIIGPPGDVGAMELFTVTFQADVSGTAIFKTNPADQLPTFETTVYGHANAVDPAMISYGFNQLTIVGGAPGSPANLVATSISNQSPGNPPGQIDLTWDDNSNNESGFEIERRIGSTGSWSKIGTTNANEVGYSDKHLHANVSYDYRVRAINLEGDSEWSDVVSKRPLLAAFQLSLTDTDNQPLPQDQDGQDQILVGDMYRLHVEVADLHKLESECEQLPIVERCFPWAAYLDVSFNNGSAFAVVGEINFNNELYPNGHVGSIESDRFDSVGAFDGTNPNNQGNSFGEVFYVDMVATGAGWVSYQGESADRPTDAGYPFGNTEAILLFSENWAVNTQLVDYGLPVSVNIFHPAVGALSILEDAGQQVVNLTGITAGGNEIQPLRVTATSSNPGLIPDPTVIYRSNETTGTLRFTPLPDQYGIATITVTVEDGGLDGALNTTADNATFSRLLNVVVQPVNDLPTLDPIDDQDLPLGTSYHTVPLSGITAGGGESQPLRVTAVSSNSSLVTPVGPNAGGWSPTANLWSSANGGNNHAYEVIYSDQPLTWEDARWQAEHRAVTWLRLPRRMSRISSTRWAMSYSGSAASKIPLPWLSPNLLAVGNG